jgi:uncharacterized protein YggE
MNARLLLAGPLFACLYCSVVLAQETGITVMGTGEATVKPNRLEIDLKASSTAELTSDAVVKYRDSLRRAKDAFDKLKLEKLEIGDRGLNVTSSNPGQNPNQWVNGNPVQNNAKAEVGISKSLRLTITGVDKLSEEDVVAMVARLLDTAKDAGVATGNDSKSQLMARFGMSVPNSMVTFVADDPSAAMKKASEAAFQDAKQNATRLADLAGVKLGPVISVEDISTGGSKEKSMQEKMVSMVYGVGTSDTEDPRMAANTLVELPVRVTLRVRVAIQNPSGAAK